MGWARGVVFLVSGVALLLACRALSLGPETPEPGTPGAIPGFTRLTPGDRAMYAGPSWSPDGQRIVYSRAEFTLPSLNLRSSEIFALDLLSGDVVRLTENQYEDRDPDWSPDGSQIIFVRIEPPRGTSTGTLRGRSLLMIVRPDGSGEQVVFECPRNCHSPDWSPDGEQIAFSTDMIWLIGADGSGARKMDLREFGNALHPTWSSDGNRLAFYGEIGPFAPGLPHSPRGYLVMFDMESGEDSTLAEVYAFDPDWSPDGSSILFSSYPSAASDYSTLLMVPSQGGRPIRVISETLIADIFDPAWSPDAQRIVVAFGSPIQTSTLYLLDVAQYRDGGQ